MKISQAGLRLLKQHEGFSATRYLCPAGKPTIGYGHVIRVEEIIEETISEERAEELLLDDLHKVERCLEFYIHVPLDQHEYDALSALIFNIGIGAFRGSTLRKKLNQGDRIGAAKEFVRWNKSGSKVLPGLVARREAEKALFLA